MGECSFWYRPTRVVPDQRPLNGRCCCCHAHTINVVTYISRYNNNISHEKLFSGQLPTCVLNMHFTFGTRYSMPRDLDIARTSIAIDLIGAPSIAPSPASSTSRELQQMFRCLHTSFHSCKLLLYCLLYTSPSPRD